MSQSLDRALQIIEKLSDGPQGLGALSEMLGVHRSTVLRLLQTLEQHSYARRTPNGMWRVGFGLISAGQRSLDSIDLRSSARPDLVALGAEFGHTIHLAELMNNAVVYIDKVEGPGSVKMHSRIGDRALVHTSAVAKAILAFAPSEVSSAAIGDCQFERYTATTITSAEDFSAELDLTRTRGWAVDNAEFEDFLNCVAVPIFGSQGEVLAAISVTALKALAPLSSLEARMDQILATRDSVSAEFGWSTVNES